jgi:hypothetical protein
MAIYRYRYSLNNALKRTNGELRKYATVTPLDADIMVDVDTELPKVDVDKIMDHEGWEFVSDITNLNHMIARKRYLQVEYPLSGKTLPDKVQFTQVFLSKGERVKSFETFLTKVKVGAFIKVGLYSQVTPGDINGAPLTLLCSGQGAPTKNDEDSFFNIPLDGISEYSIANAGYYWISFLSETPSMSVASSLVHRQGFHKVLWSDDKLVSLPAEISDLEERQNGIAYVSAITERSS